MPGSSSSKAPRSSSMTSSELRARWDRGFSRTTMSPVFCAVANRPSSAPVRRAKPATSGVALRTFSMRPTIRSVSGSDVPAGVQ